jgi:hypothetical protein
MGYLKLSNHLENLEKKLKEIKTLSSGQPLSLDNLPMPKLDKPSSEPKGIRAPKANEQASKKDPTKVAAQLQNADDKKMQMDAIKRGSNKLVKFNENGQWYLEE